MITSAHWQQRIGNQRNWVWRGWQTRYTYIRASMPSQETVPLILLHGFGASIGHWRHNLPVFGERHTVYALDLLGFGASQKATVKYQVQLWVEQVYDFWRTFIRQPAILIGNSIGSLVAVATAAAHPDMVSGLIMMSLPDPALEAEKIPQFFQPVVAGIKSLIASPPLLKALFQILRRPAVVRRWAGIAYANPHAITPELVDILSTPAYDRRASHAFIGILRAMLSPRFSPRIKEILPTLTVPMLLLWGKQDRMVPPALARELAAYNPNLQLLELEHVGHCPHDECPEQVNQIILSWISKHRSG